MILKLASTEAPSESTALIVTSYSPDSKPVEGIVKVNWTSPVVLDDE